MPERRKETGCVVLAVPRPLLAAEKKKASPIIICPLPIDGGERDNHATVAKADNVFLPVAVDVPHRTRVRVKRAPAAGAGAERC